MKDTERIKHVVATMAPLLAAIRKAGATQWHVSVGRFFDGQCNEEYSQEELLLIASLQCGLTYSAYEVSEDEEEDLKARHQRAPKWSAPGRESAASMTKAGPTGSSGIS